MSSAATPSKIEITHYNVGQGDAHSITVDNTTVLIDGDRKAGKQIRSKSGRITKSSKQIQREIAGQTTLIFIATHYDMDHIAGLDRLLKHVNVDKFYVPHEEYYNDITASAAATLQTADKQGVSKKKVTNTTTCHIGTRQIDVDFLFPELMLGLPTGLLTKNDGIVTKFSTNSNSSGKDVSILFPGDLSVYIQNVLTREQKQELSVDGLVLPHHGSRQNLGINCTEIPSDVLDSIGVNRTENGDLKRQIEEAIDSMGDVKKLKDWLQSDFLELIDPDEVVISARPTHNYNHPHLLTLAALHSSEITPNVYCTYRDGDITWNIDPSGSYSIETQDSRMKHGTKHVLNDALK
ncbi:MBL fold metallo-hydrolase [Halorubrum ezzemoulense]|uniref:ComEC/Rec2 family competence protein n=1 Tax=Halorubrum ezzemoulense TaxID=337243 RepID=UPI00232D57EB|nr:MBL fold metallo-hydrolase [Halorubrum ezzemoulense]MDB2287024.1 MBL fold metallo-hydrolase [Halorubrum ezzemoulense]